MKESARITGGMGRLFGRAATPIAVGVCVSLLAGSVTLGLRLPGFGFLAPLPPAGGIDYSAAPAGGFAPLEPRLVSQLFGSDLRTGPAATADAAANGNGASTLSSIPPPVVVSHAFTNDNFAQAYPIRSVPFTGETTTSNATTQQGEPRSCSALGGGTAWYSFTASRDVGLQADTFGSNYATSLTVYTGARLARLKKVGSCSSDARGNALIAFPAKAQTRYFFQIAGPIGGRLVFTLQQQGVTTLASGAADGRAGDGFSVMPTFSADGRMMLFTSGASTFENPPGRACVTFAPYAPCGEVSPYLRDRATHRTVNEYPEQSIVGGQTDAGTLGVTGSLSAEGRYAAFWAPVEIHTPGGPTPLSPERWEVFRRDNLTGDLEQVSVPCRGCGTKPDSTSGRAEISADGRYIAFLSFATNLVKGDTNGVRDIFVRDMERHVTTRVSVPNDADAASLDFRGQHQANDATSAAGTLFHDQGSDLFSISNDGRYVVFNSSASNLVRGDTNGFTDVFVRDLAAKTTTRVNVSSAGRQANGETRSVLGLGVTTISNDGRYVFFNSDATNLVSGGTKPGVENVYRRDFWLHKTILVNVSSTGEPANAGVGVHDPLGFVFTFFAPVLVAGDPTVTASALSYSATPDGRYIVFNSDAPNLVPGDTNETTDCFLHDVKTGATTRISVSTTGTESNRICFTPNISDNGRFAAFSDNGTNLVGSNSSNNNYQVYVRELPGPHPFSRWY